MQCPRGTKRDEDGGRVNMRQLCLAPTLGRFLYSPVGETIASSSVNAVCAGPATQESKALGVSNVSLTLLGVYCQVHDRAGLSRLQCDWPCSQHWGAEELLAVCWHSARRGYGGAAWPVCSVFPPC